MNYYALQKNNNEKSATYGKYHARPQYADKFVPLDDIAAFIEKQASVKCSDCKAVIQELGEAIQHHLKMGMKVKIAGLGIFKPTVSSKGVANLADWNQAEHLKPTRLMFTPEKIKIGNHQMTKMVSEVTWSLVEVANNSKGEALAGRAAVRAAKNSSQEDQEGDGE